MPWRLEASVVDAASERAIPNAQVWLIRAGPTATPEDTLERLSGPDGRLAFDSLPPGRYLLRVAFIGYRARVDTLVVAPQRPLGLVVPLEPVELQLGAWPPDSHVVAAARAQRNRWICDRDPHSVASERQNWVRWLNLSGVRTGLGWAPGDTVTPAAVVQVRDRQLCLQAADTYDERIGATGLATTVFVIDGYYLVSQPTWDARLILDKALTVVQHIVTE